MIRDVLEAYEQFEFYRVYQRIYQFCSVDLSSFYLDVLKDRLYAEAPTAPTAGPRSSSWRAPRRDLTRLLAPIIPHTAEELWDFVPTAGGETASVHLAELPEPDPAGTTRDWTVGGRS